jgi:hypothetical protein
MKPFATTVVALVAILAVVGTSQAQSTNVLRLPGTQTCTIESCISE